MKITKNSSADQRMTYTLNLIQKTLYEHGFAVRLFHYLKYAEDLVVENQETENRDQLDALELFIDFMKRMKTKALRAGDMQYVHDEIKKVNVEAYKASKSKAA